MSAAGSSYLRLLGGLLAAGVVALAGPPSSGEAATATGLLGVVQAVPGSAVTVQVDAQVVAREAGVGLVTGRLQLPTGRHVVTFTDSAGQVLARSSLRLGAGSSVDVVLHLPAAVAGAPVVNLYRIPRGPLGVGRARVVLAHTATVAPADVRVDGKVIFTDIANGEFAKADVAAGSHSVALLATGRSDDPLLGPLDLTLEPHTVTMVYAVGRPSAGSMSMVTHVEDLRGNATMAAPTSMDTGSAGLAVVRSLRSFGPTG